MTRCSETELIQKLTACTLIYKAFVDILKKHGKMD